MDNLNTHNGALLYEAFEATEARHLWERLQVHYTPKHGSWLNMAEIELSVLLLVCMRRRMQDIETLSREDTAWTQ
jgi:hypothetical protein